MSWLRVSKSHKCEACGSDSWCTRTSDGELALCMRVQSDRPKELRSGEVGWLHKVGAAPVNQEWKKQEEKPKPAIDWEVMMQRLRYETSSLRIQALSKSLGLPASALMELDVVYSPMDCAYGFPMQDGAGKLVGLRLRKLDGAKFAVTGSSQGLFVSTRKRKPDDMAFVVEGPTSCAAGIAMGLYCIGRPSCSGGVTELKQFLERHPSIKRVVIVADNDEDKERNGHKFNPGLDGAESLARLLPMPTCKLMLPCKDARALYQSGGNAEMVESLLSGMKWSR